jgi:GR25 family glycosyltransferase involved in LPS biosynthesis
MKSKTFIINLEHQKDRKEKMEAQLKASGIINYEFFQAIDGSKLKMELVPLPDEIDRAHLGEEFRHHFSTNEIACLLSHIEVIKTAKEHNLDYVIILEDDVVLCEDWSDRLTKSFKLTPKSWNHIYLSGQPNELIQRESFQPLNLAPFLHIERSINTMGAFSYVLKRDVYDLVIKELSNAKLPTDDVIKDLIISKKLNSYTFYPFLTYHENEIPSTIWDKKIWEQEYSVDHDSKRFFVKKL